MQCGLQRDRSEFSRVTQGWGSLAPLWTPSNYTRSLHWGLHGGVMAGAMVARAGPEETLFRKRRWIRRLLWLLLAAATAGCLSAVWHIEFASTWSWLSQTFQGLSSWYLQRFVEFPKRTLEASAALVLALVSFWLMMKAHPSFPEARYLHSSKRTYFWLDTSYFFAMFVVLPANVISVLLDWSIFIEAALATITVSLVVTATWMTIRRVKDANQESEREEKDISMVVALGAPILAVGTSASSGGIKFLRFSDGAAESSEQLRQLVRLLEGWLEIAKDWIGLLWVFLN